mmetsp:Transcript_11390/g.11403  ORF Transcript_11390/g.11403 Transcript_11390/m.11403 type:complete len:225 (+) Transcript_11390:27-701(+)|eukprot:CAMPEP_0170543230 /NCGR_PEP_ID=MMETSP0211-20121228/2418_1 /TAXON_ID=311385 /ORGANISM="Pseudokeronopsis sp., Strain OXSARD2" /LENGTH=224 /DNA_ID=CAMNT_0010846553 /DNA_START=12 /DNA_END=686 /DNA_ORIENTATION=-
MSDVDDFKSKKREFKGAAVKVEEKLDKCDTISDASTKVDVIFEIRSELGTMEKLIKEMEELWGYLDSLSKSHYKTKLTEAKSKFELLRKKFVSQENSVKNEAAYNSKMNQFMSESDKMDGNIRNKNLNNIENMHGQNNQLNNIKGMGVETHQILQGANKELREQRDVIINVSDKTKDIRTNLTLADNKIKEMSKREFCYRIALYATMILLLAAIILTVVMKIIN